MANDSGNAVVAEWVGPSGHQLFDGTVLNPGVVVRGIGKDEAEGSDYWKVVGDLDSYDDDIPDSSAIRDDWSHGVEEGGGATGRPLTDAQLAEIESATHALPQRTATPVVQVPDSDPDDDEPVAD